ncbi:aminotransferase class IV [Streptomyces corynorhini]|uniref:Class IV aminotransferase n=1 Tax=Streptomyces corynorhini TaxID=2282652 RepID=A0A370B0N4_9ACTN|nr:aminotransferase class IV [Streptomyces corynorhini]RDG35408.1 class IV aminotransferase [Streptomyces corynorhini]
MTTSTPRPAARTAPDLLIEVDEHPATEAELGQRVMNTYGHFSALQVRGGRVRGLARHLARLDGASRELFGAGLDGERVRSALRHALGDVADASARVYAHERAGADGIALTVTVRPPSVPEARAVSLMSVPYQRPVAHLKHLGGFAQIHYGRVARRAGFDDALLTGPGGVVSEGAITNIAFWDGDTVVWPDAPALTGITMALLEAHLPAAGIASVRREVTLADLPRHRAAFVTNSIGISAVSRIDDTVLPGDAALIKAVREVYDGVEWERM